MKKVAYMATMCVSLFLCTKGIADQGVTNQAVSTTPTNSLPAFVESVEIEKTGVDLSSSNSVYTVSSTNRAEFLAMLTRLQKGYGHGIENTVNPTPAQKQAISEIREARKKLAEAGAIPVWDGSKWVDGRRLAINNADLPASAVNVLVALNYWEQNYGSLSVPDKMKRIQVVSGEASATISSLKKQLERAGFRVELDKSLGIWKVRTEGEGVSPAKP